MKTNSTTFVPMLTIPDGTMDITFYKNAFGAVELRRWSNNDGSVHVAEMGIDGALFHLRQENPGKGVFSPTSINGVSNIIGLMVADVDAVMIRAVTAGAIVNSPAQDYDYGYRQGELIDPFGHRWMIEKVIG